MLSLHVQSRLHLAMSEQKNQPHKQTSQPQLQTAGLAVSSGVHGQARGWGWQVGRQVSGTEYSHTTHKWQPQALQV